jgi:collagenase-like PrtC family protease
MKITLGVNSLEEIDYFLTRGADEIYCGLSQIQSHRRASLSFNDITQIYEAIRIAHAFNKKIFLVVNEIYPPQHYAAVTKCLAKVIERHIDGIIARDISLLSFLGKIGLKTRFILSSLAVCFNAKTLQFYKKYNISRIALPQHLLPSEARELICNDLHIEVEVFFLPECYCVNIDGLCLLHDQTLYKKNFLRYPCEIPLRRVSRATPKCDRKKFSMPGPPLSCHLENLYNFYAMGAQYLKISRIKSLHEKIIVFREAIELLQFLKDGAPRRLEFIRKGSEIIERWSRRKRHCY